MKAQLTNCGSTNHASILSAWRQQVAQSADDPTIRKQILNRERELLPRFASHYTKLSALPRRARRSLQREWKRSLGGVALMLALGPTPALAAIITVGPTCTLVNAITSANTDTAIGGCAAGSLADTVVLPAPPAPAQILTTVNNTVPTGIGAGPNGLPVISTVITIQGNGATIRRAVLTAPEFRIFDVAAGGRLTLQQTIVSGGKLTGFDGGGVYNHGALAVNTNSTIAGNGAKYGGGVYNYGTFTMASSTISGNNAGYGGGVYNFGTFTMTGSTISGNTASDDGGGVYNDASQVFTMVNSTISGNNASSDGGGVYNDSAGDITMINGTLSDNTASRGGGVYNTATGKLTLDSTLISGNVAPSGREVYSKAAITTNNFNLFGFNGVSGLFNVTPGVTDVVPPAGVLLADILDPLADNPGLTAVATTQTHALVAGSPAIDAVGEGCPPPATDQRGITRPQSTACDIGAFELAGAAPPPTGTTSLQFSAPTFNVTEAAGSATITVTRTGAATVPASADFAASGGTATAGADYTVPPATVAFAPNETSKTVAIPIINDTDIEGSETANLTLSNPVGATLGTQSTAVLTIADDDGGTMGATPKCNGLVATKFGTAVPETIIGTAGPDVINGLGGSDKIFGVGGNDVICGAGGNDQINGGPGSDQCNGGGGTDTGAACEVKLNIP